MKLAYPSREFDEAVASVCHGSLSDEQARTLNELLRGNASARDEYILRLELHSRLASTPDLFAQADNVAEVLSENVVPLPSPPRTRIRKAAWPIALAACVALFLAGWWGWRVSRQNDRAGSTSKAVAMLNRVAEAQWEQNQPIRRLGAPIEPGWLRLKSGLAQIVFYSGARVAIEGPAELQLLSPDEAVCRSGRLVAEVPPQAHGFRVRTPQMSVTDLGTVFGLDVKAPQTELHVFKGRVEFQPAGGVAGQNLLEGSGAVAKLSQPARLISANAEVFTSLFDLQSKSSAAEVLRHEQWRAASSRLDDDPSLLVHFDFEQVDTTDWRLPNTSNRKDAAPEAAIVGCQWTEGRWPDKRALEFRSVSDRVRMSVPGEFESLTLAAWVRVQGLDRQFNSLFMSDGFEAGTLHWLIRKDGVLGVTAINSGPGDVQIIASPSVLALDEFGIWMHLAVVLDGREKRATHYVNGTLVMEKALKNDRLFRVGAAELGNWNASGLPANDPALIRNFSGAMDEFCLFGRALAGDEIRALYSAGKPQPDPLLETRN